MSSSSCWWGGRDISSPLLRWIWTLNLKWLGHSKCQVFVFFSDQKIPLRRIVRHRIICVKHLHVATFFWKHLPHPGNMVFVCFFFWTCCSISKARIEFFRVLFPLLDCWSANPVAASIVPKLDQWEMEEAWSFFFYDCIQNLPSCWSCLAFRWYNNKDMTSKFLGPLYMELCQQGHSHWNILHF